VFVCVCECACLEDLNPLFLACVLVCASGEGKKGYMCEQYLLPSVYRGRFYKTL